MNNQAWTSAGKDALWFSIAPVAAYILGNYANLPSLLSFLVWSAKIFAVSYLLIRLTRKFGTTQPTYGYSQAFRYGYIVCLLSSVICTAVFVIDIFVLRPDFLAETISKTFAALETQGMATPGLTYDGMMKTLPTTLTVVYFLYLNACGLLFSLMTALVAKRSNNPFENEPTQEQE